MPFNSAHNLLKQTGCNATSGMSHCEGPNAIEQQNEHIVAPTKQLLPPDTTNQAQGVVKHAIEKLKQRTLKERPMPSSGSGGHAAGVTGWVANRVTALENSSQERPSGSESSTGDDPSKRSSFSRDPSRSTMLSNLISKAQEKARRWGEHVALDQSGRRTHQKSSERIYRGIARK